MNPCCCSAPTPSICDICIEGSNVSIDTAPGFLFDGETSFAGVTDSTELFVIPTGCVTDGHSTACFDALNTEWKLARLFPGSAGETCVDYFGETIDCAAVTCWWSSVSYAVCPNNCTIGPNSVCAGGPRGNDELTARIIVDASSDPTYVILIVELTSNWGRFHCCIDGDYGTGAHPIYQMRAFYRVAKASFTCLCALCFAKYDEQLIQGASVPCLNLPDHIRVNPRASGATSDQLAEANAHCGAPDYQVNIDCAVPEGCGHTLCTYEAQDTGGTLEWVYVSGICIEGCICPDHAGLIAAGFPQPKYATQALSVDTDCVTGDKPCSTILGRCCYTDESGVHCVDNIDECDCYSEHSGCWDVGTGIDCAHPDAGYCTCVTPVGLCCWNDGSDHCSDNVTEAECSTLSSGTGGWVEQDLAGSFSCAGDHGGLSNCGPGCDCSNSTNCGYIVLEGASPTGYVWSLDTDVCSGITYYCSCAPVDAAFYAIYGYPTAGSSSFSTSCSGCS